MEGQPHPYAPTDLKLPGYVPNFLTQFTIVSVYGLSSLLVVSLIWILSDCSCAGGLTGLTHLILEGYFVFWPEFYKDKTAHYLAEGENIAKVISRYAARDAARDAVEGVTAVFEGPASLLAVYAIASGKSYSYILQFSVSLGQLYGTAVYFLTAYLEGDHFAASSYHYYVYYIGANASWVVIPSLIAVRCWNKICSAVQVQGQKRTKSH
ncbi:C-8,7 sterol isomerase [Populus alba x Populus x berolinensis]|uniref:C-8,7 sterol isomerase n=1 Tax=Populus alba x Populus x berolinensis TaxID=444605 RepID=A0AAD6RKN6_9ROSI|nr:C-8,7 sterol isomerase [Populus alba x Populus x berolinensis]